ncbi:MAG: hypothetical protein QOG62_1790 [Thermoleophilaceae bacterium]|nr:hypothetical protein [Thermoleophilaceae bacterium]
MGAKRAEHQTIITGTPQQCFDALTDYDAIRGWQSAIKRCEIRTTDANGRAKEVFWELDADARSISYTLTYNYEPPSWIGYGYVEGDISDVQGEYTFEDRGDGSTLATLSLKLEPGVWLPDPVARALEDQVMKGSLEDLKAHLEA